MVARILGISFWSGLRFCWLRVTHRNSHSAQQNGQIAENRADQHHLRRRFVPDSPLEEGVYCELVSESEISEVSIPDNWAVSAFEMLINGPFLPTTRPRLAAVKPLL